MATEHLLNDRNPEASDVARETLALLVLLEAARSAEWSPVPASAVWESDKVSRRGEVQDPTHDLATDSARLALRVSVWDAWRAVHGARVQLARALEPFGGV